jgi:hypothetical protein
MLRHDVSVQCTLDNGDVTTVTVLSEPRCVGPSCTAQEALDAANYVPAREMNFYFDEFILDASCVLTVAEPSDAAFVAPTKPTSTAFHYRQQFLCTKWVMTAVTTALLLILT